MKWSLKRHTHVYFYACAKIQKIMTNLFADDDITLSNISVEFELRVICEYISLVHILRQSKMLLPIL